MLKIKDLRAMSIDELEAKLLEKKKEQFNLRIQQSTGQLQNTAVLRSVRREVAKINTLITERKKSKKYAAHDENNQFKVGDVVRIEESVPYSKTKCWTVIVDNA